MKIKCKLSIFIVVSLSGVWRGMNKSAYLTTGLAIKALSRLSKADILVHGKENIPPGPIIFVMNHFTRIETILLPNYISDLTGKPGYSLAAASLFKGGLGKFFDLVGVISTADPKRDALIVQSLLGQQANWIIFPEGSMVKTKKIVEGGKYMIAHPDGAHEPHTGAAVLALKAELFRRQLMKARAESPEKVGGMLDILGVKTFHEVAGEPTTIVPVNLTYYPIRAAENIALSIASKLVKDMPERVIEEIMTEGTMLLSGVDLDIRFGPPIHISEYLHDSWINTEFNGLTVSPELKKDMKATAYSVMQRYMDAIYSLTTVNHEHLFASFLRFYPFKRILEREFKRRVFYAASLISDGEKGLETIALHKSLKKNQAHLLTDDRYKKYKNFLKLAIEKGVVKRDGDYLIRDRAKISAPLSLHRGRINNPVEVIANEAEPLKALQSFMKSIAWQPNTLMSHLVARYMLRRDKARYESDCKKYGSLEAEGKKKLGRPFLLRGYRNTGVVLVHSYLSQPREVMALARALRNKGFWVYGQRLPGHGTSAEDLAGRKYKEWIEAVENGYVLMSSYCREVVVGGVGLGGSLCLDLAARVKGIKGVFAVSPAFSLKNYSTEFMPGRDVLNRILNKLKRGEAQEKYLAFAQVNGHINYVANPVEGIRELGEFLESIEKSYTNISQPVLIIQADGNPVVSPKGSGKVFGRIGSSQKEFSLLSSDQHILVNGKGSTRVLEKIILFVQGL
ncbi:glycerol acyltransferase [Desulforhopalus sp. IMCC35007]|nr:glycerol acyltransferase [Desulforhopalus sp. IMCC35007]